MSSLSARIAALGGLAGTRLGWTAAQFWAATPSDLMLMLGVADQDWGDEDAAQLRRMIVADAARGEDKPDG